MAARRPASTSTSANGPAKRSASSAGLPSRPASRAGTINNNAQYALPSAPTRKPLSAASPNTVTASRIARDATKDKVPGLPGRQFQASAKLAPAGAQQRPQTLALAHSRQASRTGSAQSLEGIEGALAASSGSSDASQGNIKVVVRCRGANKRELAESSELCISTSATRGNEISVASTSLSSLPPPQVQQSTASSLLLPNLGRQEEVPAGRLYNFDHVFGDQADQAMLYADVVQPILDEVLLGYNCTIFAYGQTGTGKTYTMEGDLTPSPLGTFSPEAGVIPRTLHRLFHMLEDSEFTVRVSFVELYNEELRDLNASESANEESAQGLRIFDDASRKGGVVIQGVEETHIQSAAAGIKILTRGSQRRQIASTKCNDQSSRSHSIFSITVHLKEVSNKGEDLLKVGKLNLVDLAGSENVGRSGAKEGRAREAGMINQSLLTLGRVINALVEKSPHVPYRESKLTRLLQDSLGGRTKTCIIATISPARINLEETMSTLDYAARAKSIRNKPEVNSRMTKAALLSQYAIEIERLKADVLAAREKNGIYLSDESWAEISSEHDARKAALNEAKRQADIFQSQMRTTKEQFDQALRVLGVRDTELKTLNEQLDTEKGSMRDLQTLLQGVQKELEDETVLRLANQDARKQWRQVASQAVEDVDGLRAKILRKTVVEDKNATTVQEAHDLLSGLTSKLSAGLARFQALHTDSTSKTSEKLQAMTESQLEGLSSNHAFISEQLLSLQESSTAVRGKLDAQDIMLSSFLQVVESTSQEILEQSEKQQEAVLHLAGDMCTLVKEECASVLQSSEDALKQVVEGIDGLQAAIAADLKKQAEFAKAQKDAEQKALLEENERLRQHNDMLARLLLEQRQAAARWQTEFIASMTSNISAFNASQDELLQRNVGTLQTELSQASSARAKKGKAREAAFGQLADGIRACQGDLDERCGRARKIARLHTEASSKHGSTLQLDLASRSTAISTAFEAHSQTTRQGVSGMQRQCEKFEEAQTSHTTALRADFDLLVQGAEDTYADLQEDMQERQQDMKADQEDLAEMAHQYEEGTVEYLAATAESTHQIQSHLKSRLREQMAIDLPTGMTPIKRTWPEALLSGAEDPLDAQDRQALLAEVAKQRASSVPEEEADSLADMPAGGPRLSNTIAARKAARRSSALRA